MVFIKMTSCPQDVVFPKRCRPAADGVYDSLAYEFIVSNGFGTDDPITIKTGGHFAIFAQVEWPAKTGG